LQLRSFSTNLENLARSIEGDVLNDEEIVVTAEHEGIRMPHFLVSSRDDAWLI
jgi:hypothetical protein